MLWTRRQAAGAYASRAARQSTSYLLLWMTAVFVSRVSEVKQLKTLFHKFGELSGLKMQPAKSWYIDLSKAASQVAVHGIPTVHHGDSALPRSARRYWRNSGGQLVGQDVQDLSTHGGRDEGHELSGR